MTRNSECKLCVMMLLTILIASSVYAVLAPKAYAAVVTVQQEGLAVLNEVVGLDLAKYEVATREFQPDVPASYLGVVPQENVGYDLTSTGSSLKMLLTFANGKLHMIHVTENLGQPIISLSAGNASPLEQAQSFLANYEAHTANHLFGQLKSTLNNVDLNGDFSKQTENAMLEVTHNNGYTHFKWYYSSNGVIAPYSKFIGLVFKDGFLAGFIDNWQLYNVGSASVEISEEEAIAVALETAKTKSHSLGLDSYGFEERNINESNVRWTSLVFDCSLGGQKARSEDPLALWASLSISVAIGTGNVLVFVCKRRSKPFHPLKLRYSRRGGILLCILMLSPLLFAQMTTVSASTKTAAIWGSESSGAYGYGPGNYTWRKSQNEIGNQSYMAGRIQGYFAANGYTAYNNQGTNGSTSFKQQILNAMGNYTNASSRVAFVDFDHGNGRDDSPGAPGEFHFLFEDQNGTIIGDYEGSWLNASENGVYDYEIYNKTSSGKTAFAFINTCNSASLVKLGTWEPWQGLYNGKARGMPFALLHSRTVEDKGAPGFDFNIGSHMSDDGYFGPDDGSQVFIGFLMGSASLSQRLPYDTGTHTYCYWVNEFFIDALYMDLSVNQALDHASFQTWGVYFANQYNPLHGFTSYWWMGYGDTTGPGRMAVYGNGRIRLEGFSDDFDDGNYAGWSVLGGSWTVTGGKLKATKQYSLIRTGQQFTTDRHVRATVRTLNSGNGARDVAWVMAKYVDASNQVYGLLHKNLNVELTVLKGGQSRSYIVAGGSNPLTTRMIDIDVVGTKAYMYIDGQLKLNVTDSWLDDFGGYVGLYTHKGATAEFDDVTLLEESSQQAYPELTILASTGGSTNPPPHTYNYLSGWPVTVNATADSGYQFDYWLLDGSPDYSGNPITVTMNSDYVLQPIFSLIPPPQRTLMMLATTGGTTTPASPGSYQYPQNSWQNVQASPNSGYRFANWSKDGSYWTTSNPANVYMDNDHSVQAIFQSQEKLTVQTATGGYTTPGAGDYWYDTNTWSASFTASANNGYRFDHWHKGGVDAGSSNPISVYMDTDYTLQPQFVSQEKLTVQTATGGYTVPGAGEYWYDTSTWSTGFTANPNGGYEFSHWHVDGVDAGTSNPKSVYMDIDHTLQPQFSAVVTFENLTVQDPTGGYTTPSPGIYPYQTNTWSDWFTASPDSAYWRFDHWHKDGADYGNNNPERVYMDTDHTMLAMMVERRKLTMNSWYGVSYTDPSVGDHWYDINTNVQCTVVPISHWQFDHWHRNGVDYSWSNPCSVSMDADYSMTPIMAPQYQIYFDSYDTTTSNQIYGANVDIDYSPAGYTSFSYWMRGSHYLTAEYQIYYNGNWYLFDHWYINGNTYTDLTISYSFTSSTTVQLWYTLSKKAPPAK